MKFYGYIGMRIFRRSGANCWIFECFRNLLSNEWWEILYFWVDLRFLLATMKILKEILGVNLRGWINEDDNEFTLHKFFSRLFLEVFYVLVDTCLHCCSDVILHTCLLTVFPLFLFYSVIIILGKMV